MDKESNSPNSPPFKLSIEDFSKLKKVEKLLHSIEKKYNLSYEELKSLLKEDLVFPTEILNKKLTVLETIVKYLKEEKSLSLRNIANSIGRDERNIWHIYSKAKKKYPKKFIIKEVKYWVPVSIFSNTKLSALEALVWYLKEKFSLNYHEIALLLKRDDRTIWTVYQRARKKNA